MSNNNIYKQFVQREANILRAPYNPELEFYSIIRAGNVKKVKELCSDSFISKPGLGTLSNDSLQNYKYHLVITIAIIARYCIDGGMAVSTAYTLSDFYIQKADACTTSAQIDEIHQEVCIDYAKRMSTLQKKSITSKHIARCIDYINDNLHVKLTVPLLASYLELNPTYLSRLFKAETGMSVSEYIQHVRIETAKNMLLYSDYPVVQISSALSFSDQSYFTAIFKKHTGVTPSKFQMLHLREMELKPIKNI